MHVLPASSISSYKDHNDNQVLTVTQQFQITSYYDLIEHGVSAQGWPLGNRSCNFGPCCLLFPKAAWSFHKMPSPISYDPTCRMRVHCVSTPHLILLPSCGVSPNSRGLNEMEVISDSLKIWALVEDALQCYLGLRSASHGSPLHPVPLGHWKLERGEKGEALPWRVDPETSSFRSYSKGRNCHIATFKLSPKTRFLSITGGDNGYWGTTSWGMMFIQFFLTMKTIHMHC